MHHIGAFLSQNKIYMDMDMGVVSKWTESHAEKKLNFVALLHKDTQE